ncbi:mechanosensitive ion channel protein MscS [Kiloniella spongiae]|uniref:Mechanosensitive ion channel protein MscS n=1 Tax=Kiloniella spongiae TaxID=1489064 RepID=A0A0H2MDN6_9PROT|nr:mechanosensitive ion channel family protein [Kiloniella spongiae]KLN60649.1 mechanosensitive ion channel protein MscS [Kiloniella spongiae]
MEDLSTFWEITHEVWNQGVFGLSIGHIVTSIAIFFAFLVIRGLFSKLVINRLRALTRKTKNSVDDHALEALEGPIRMIPIALGVFFALDHLNLGGEAAVLGNNLVRSLIAYTLFYAVFKLIDPLDFLLHRFTTVLTSIMVDWIIKALKICVVLLGAASILELWGINVGAIIAGLGLFGVAVALGAQDLFKNLIAGILIIAEKRFSRGDWVRIEGIVEGTVEDIGFRSTRIRRFDKAPVYVPNAKLADNAVINFSKMTNRRIYWKIGLEYDTTSEQLRKIVQEIKDHLYGTEAFETDDARATTLVNVDSFNSSSIDIMIYCFTKTTNWGDWMNIKEDFALKLKEIVENNDSAFAFPTSTLHVASLPESPAQIRSLPGLEPETPLNKG